MYYWHSVICQATHPTCGILYLHNLLLPFLGSIFKPCYIQNRGILNSVIKRLWCNYWVLHVSGCTNILGEVLFNCNYPEEPPDFIFGSEDVDFFPNIDNIRVSLLYKRTVYCQICWALFSYHRGHIYIHI